MYDDPRSTGRPPSPPDGQRCVACGHIHTDPWARFCGVCGALLVPGAGPGAPVQGGSATPTVQPTAAPVGPQGRPGSPPPWMAGPTPSADRGDATIYTVGSLAYGDMARIGAAVSAAFALVPCVLFGFAGAWLVHAGRDLLESWQRGSVRAPVPLASVDIGMNFIELLRLRPLFDAFVYWDDRLWLTFALLWLIPWTVAIVAGALFGLVFAMVYGLIHKLGGGARVALAPIQSAPTGPPAAPAPWGAGSAPAPPAAW